MRQYRSQCVTIDLVTSIYIRRKAISQIFYFLLSYLLPRNNPTRETKPTQRQPSNMTSTTAAEIINLKPISDPYPIPSVENVTIEKENVQQDIGIKIMSMKKGVILLNGITPGSILAQQTKMKVGQEILAINGHAVHGINQVVDMIRDNRKLVFTVFDHTKYKNRMPPFCYVEVTPTSRINPGISFDSCRNRSMVVVGDIIGHDLSKTRLHEGDIVLAVNGIPVWKPEMADALQIQAARDGQALVLYCLDVEALRDHFLAHVDKVHTLPGNDIRHTRIQKVDRDTVHVSERECRAVARVDRDGQLYQDETPWQMRLKAGDKNLYVKNSYTACSMTIEALNKLLAAQLLVIESKIVAQAWYASLKNSETKIPTYSISVTQSPSTTTTEIASQQNGTLPQLMIPTVHATPIDETNFFDL